MCLFIVLFSALIACLVCDWGPLISTFGVKKKLLKSRTVSCNIIHCMQRGAFFLSFLTHLPLTCHLYNGVGQMKALNNMRLVRCCGEMESDWKTLMFKISAWRPCKLQATTLLLITVLVGDTDEWAESNK